MSLNKNKTSYNYTFGGRLDVYGKLTAASDTTINGKLNAENISIGTNNPQEKLHIHEGDVVIGQDSGNSTDIRNYIKFGRVDAPKAAIGFINTTANGRGDIIFMSDNDGNTSAFNDSDERVRITRNGRVGIATDNPQRTLDVVGSIRKTEYEPGEIIETLVGVCDGNPVTVKSGTYTLENVNAVQAAGDNYATISGSSINYVPPPGTTRVCYEFWVFMRDAGAGSGSRPLLHFQSQLDNSSGTPTLINNSRHTWRFVTGTDVQDVQTWIYNKAIVSIGQVGTESVANGRLVSWDSARTFRWRFRRYSASYDADLHETQHWDGTGTNVRVRPHVKITAIA